MHHLAIMKKSWGLTDKILSGQKTIESRWYFNKVKPWDVVNINDIIYFKDSGDLVRVKAEVGEVKQFFDLTPSKVKELLQEYGQGIGLEAEQIPQYLEIFKNKKYCVLIFLKNVSSIQPFDVDKSGYGAMSAWITVNDINKIKNNVLH